MQHRGEIVKATWLMVAILVAACSTVRAQQAPLPQVTPAMPEAAPAGPPPAAAPDQSAAPAAQASAEALAPRPATPAPPADRRVDIKLLEGVLNAAVKNGADRLALQMRASEPGSLFVIDAGRTRGFDLQGYGVFFDVDVPMMKQSVLWSASALSQQDRRAQLQNYAATLPEGPARYLAIHPPIQLHGYTEKVVNANDQIEYIAEDPSVRAVFEQELDARGLTSLMPDEVYTNPDFVWK